MDLEQLLISAESLSGGVVGREGSTSDYYDYSGGSSGSVVSSQSVSRRNSGTESSVAVPIDEEDCGIGEQRRQQQSEVAVTSLMQEVQLEAAFIDNDVRTSISWPDISRFQSLEILTWLLTEHFTLSEPQNPGIC